MLSREILTRRAATRWFLRHGSGYYPKGADHHGTTRQHQVLRIVDLITVQLGAEQVFAAFNLEFPDEMTVPELERLIGALGATVRKTHPEVTRIFVRPEPRAQTVAAF